MPVLLSIWPDIMLVQAVISKNKCAKNPNFPKDPLPPPAFRKLFHIGQGERGTKAQATESCFSWRVAH